MEIGHELFKTTLRELPFELLDLVLAKSFLHWVLNSSPHQRDSDVVKALASVEFCWLQRITRRRFKKRILHWLKDFYGKTKRRSIIIRNNRNYFLENIHPNKKFIASLLSLNCITEEQSRFIRRQRSRRDKNAELLRVLRSFDETKISNFVKSLRQTNQRTLAKVMENGGVVIKVEVQNCGAKCTTSTEVQLLFLQKMEDLRNRTKPRSHQNYKLMRQLKKEGIEILNFQLDKKTVVVWIWCHSQAALERIEKLHKSNQMRDIHTWIAKSSQSTTEFSEWEVITIDDNQLRKTVVVCQMSIKFIERLNAGENEYVYGVTKLRSDIYVLCRSYSAAPHVIHVFEDRNPFDLKTKIEINEITFPLDIGSSEKENCLYVSDHDETCVWKITRETDEQPKPIKWLITDYQPVTMSVSSDGQLLVVDYSSFVLWIYGSDAELIRSIQLPKDIFKPIHAVKTSIGNFVIIHLWRETQTGSSGGYGESMWVVSELTRDGQMVIRRFIPSNNTERMENPEYLALDSDDQVFLADHKNRRVILLDSDLEWNNIFRTTKEKDGTAETGGNLRPLRLYFDEENKQLLVGGDFYLEEAVDVYTLNRK